MSDVTTEQALAAGIRLLKEELPGLTRVDLFKHPITDELHLEVVSNRQARADIAAEAASNPERFVGWLRSTIAGFRDQAIYDFGLQKRVDEIELAAAARIKRERVRVADELQRKLAFAMVEHEDAVRVEKALNEVRATA